MALARCLAMFVLQAVVLHAFFAWQKKCQLFLRKVQPGGPAPAMP